MGLSCITAYKLDALKAVRKEVELIDSALPTHSYNDVEVKNDLELPLQRCMDATEELVGILLKLVSLCIFSGIMFHFASLWLIMYS